MSIQTTDNRFGFGSQRIVNPVLGRGTYTTIQAAINASFSGEVVFINPGTYTEDLTLKDGVNLFCATGVTLIGQLICTYTGSVIIHMMNIQTNGLPIISASGVTACNLSMVRSVLIATDADIILWTNSNVNSILNIANCVLSLSVNTLRHFDFHTGNLNIRDSSLVNPGASTIQSTWDATGLLITQSIFESNLLVSGSGTVEVNYTEFESVNTTAVEVSNLGNNFFEFCRFDSGSAIPIQVNAGATLNVAQATINTANANITTGAGTLNYGSLVCTGTGNTLGTAVNNPFTIV